MKKLLVTFMVTGFLLACNQGSDHAADGHSKSSEEKHLQHEKKPAGLVLNNGAKWKADSSTKINVALLRDISSSAQKANLENYHQTAEQLQEGLNKMVKECKMKGPDHDALHKWLEPLVEKMKEFKKQTETERAAISLEEIKKQLNLFPIYFE